MNFEHGDILFALQDKFRFDLSQWPQVGELTRRLAQQIRAGHPTEHWGYFPHPEGREDVVGVEVAGRKYGWDIVVSAGSTAAKLNLNPDTQDLTGHEFVALEAKDWFAGVIPKPPPVPPPPAPPPTPTPSPEPDAWVKLIMASIAQLSAEHQAVLAELQKFKADGVTLETPFGTWKLKV